jgi:hypothetical protein
MVLLIVPRHINVAAPDLGLASVSFQIDFSRQLDEGLPQPNGPSNATNRVIQLICHKCMIGTLVS